MCYRKTPTHTHKRTNTHTIIFVHSFHRSSFPLLLRQTDRGTFFASQSESGREKHARSRKSESPLAPEDRKTGAETARVGANQRKQRDRVFIPAARCKYLLGAKKAGGRGRRKLPVKKGSGRRKGNRAGKVNSKKRQRTRTVVKSRKRG